MFFLCVLLQLTLIQKSLQQSVFPTPNPNTAPQFTTPGFVTTPNFNLNTETQSPNSIPATLYQTTFIALVSTFKPPVVSITPATALINTSKSTVLAPSATANTTIAATTMTITTAVPITHVQLIFKNYYSSDFNQSDLRKALNDSSIIAETIKSFNLTNSVDLAVYFDIKNNTTDYWRDQFKKYPPIVYNNKNKNISTNIIFAWNDSICDNIVCNILNETCTVVYSGNYTLKCAPRYNLSSALFTTGDNKNMSLYLALLAIPCFLVLVIVVAIVYCVCKSKKKNNIDGKFEMSQVHSTNSNNHHDQNYAHNQQRRSSEDRHTISSQGSDHKYPLPYGDDDGDENETYNYKKIDDGRSTNKSNMMF